ncbi:MAG: DUF2818 family protein [Gammaproteobacteria bacterium]|nr:DUF2818 family protein [Gammaproteobacteria bacterium]
MSQPVAIVLLMLAALIAANLPWSTERIGLIWEPASGKKSEWIRLGEWFALFALVGLAGAGLEYRSQGQLQPQGWEFWVIALCLFAVFSLPGFIYHHDLRRRLQKRHNKRAP